MGIDNPMTRGEYYPGGRSRKQYIEDCKTLIRDKQREFNKLAEQIDELRDDSTINYSDYRHEIGYLEMKMSELEYEISELESEINNEER